MSPWLAFMTGVLTSQIHKLPDLTVYYESDQDGPSNYFHLKTRMGRTFKVTVEEIETPEPEKP